MSISTSELSQATTSSSVTETKFSWQDCWYPITFCQDLPENRPYGFSIYDEPLVIFRDHHGELICVSDICPHRGAKLSDGQIIAGKLECLYHGWQFGEEGKCLHIPQLPPENPIPKTACLKSYPVRESQGIIWVWLGKKEAMKELSFAPELDREGQNLFVVDTVINLPYDQDYLVENFLDPAHIFISHDRTELNTFRENAQPLEMETFNVSAQGFQGRYRGMKQGKTAWATADFVAPHLVAYKFGNPAFGVIGGFYLYALPLGKGKSRVLIRRYGNFFKRSFKLKPRWLEHLRQNKLIEEDLALIVGQQRYIESSGKTLKEAFLPLKTSDTFVLEYRKWLDKYAQELPYCQGYTTTKKAKGNGEPMATDRLSRHTQICHSCNQAYQNSLKLKQILIAVAILLAGAAIIVDNNQFQLGIITLAFLAIATAASLNKLSTHFEKTYHL
ncbi:MAG: Rieske 2Fe-2S domain-containing protein [Spirulinaceae cyanobacterium]